MKKNFKIIIAFIIMFLCIANVNAEDISASFDSIDDNYEVGSIVKIKISINSLNTSDDDLIYSLGGTINYNSDVLQFISFEGINGWMGSNSVISDNTINILSSDLSLSNGISSGNIGIITFKVIKEGTSVISMDNAVAKNKEKDLSVYFMESSINAESLKSDNTYLSSLTINGYSLFPSFTKENHSYEIVVPNNVNSINIKASAMDDNAIVKGIGNVDITGDTTFAFINVTAENSISTSDYVIKIKKEEVVSENLNNEVDLSKVNSDSSLKSLDISGYLLSPEFKSDITSYSINVDNGITGLNVSAIPNDDNAKVIVSGNSDWKVGNNTIYITVFLDDGTKTIYEVNVKRADEKVKASDTSIKFKIFSPHKISPEFSNNIDEYNVVVPNDVTKLDLNIIPYDKKTTVNINDNLDFEVDKENIVNILVTADDGTIRTISLNVTKSLEKSNTDLKDLQVKNHILSPKFKPGITNYKIDVEHKENKIDVIVKAPEGATYEISGINHLKVGNNIALIRVIDSNGFSKYYQIDINRNAKNKFSLFYLGSIIFLIILFIFLIIFIIFHKKKKDKIKSKQIKVKAKSSINNRNDELYDLDDEEVTKDELVDALNEAIRTKNPERLRLLLKRENLNRKKRELKIQDNQAERKKNRDFYINML